MISIFRSGLLALPALAAVAIAQNTTSNNLQYVNQLIGSNNGGNVFAGATLPYGMAKAVADVDGDNQGGFATDGSNITGFSGMHDSGTGGNPSLGNFALFPYVACPGDTTDGCTYPKLARKTQYDNSSIKASPGYFAVTLDSGITVDMTTAQHTALFRFTFPPEAYAGNSSSPLILMDLTDLSDSRQDNGTINVDSDTGRITGNARFLPSFGEGNYVLYTCADFQGSSIRDNGIFVGNRSSTDVKNLTISRSINGYPLPGGAFNRFQSGSSPILARVGFSFISSDQACSNSQLEIPSFDFNATQTAAVNLWKQKISPITVSTTGVNESFLTNFYSGIYRTMIQPQNYTGENPLWQSDEPYWDSFYCIWDLFRSQNPFLIVNDPEAVESQIRSLIDTYAHLGWLPDCRMSLSKGYTQGGSNADNILTDGYLKGLTGGINWDTAYEAVVQDAEVEPYDWCCEGRGGLQSWKALGYIPVQDFDYIGFGTQTRSVSRTLEYSYNDFCISELGSGLGGHESDVEKYRGRSENWQHLFDPTTPSDLFNGTNTGFVGFFQPKFLNETFGFQDPLKCSNIDTNPNSICSLQNTGAETFESSIWEYSFFVPHDMASLITYLGGPSAFVRRLDYLHDNNITYIGNEPAFLTVYQYHYAGRPAKSALRSHFYIPSFFEPTEGGLPGNDDSGTMGAFVAFSMMGLFPNPGQNVYLIIPPYFESVSIKSPVTGKTATIRNVNFDPTYQNVYIQSATLDGEPYTKNWIDHSFFTQGKTLVLTLGATESSWGSHVADLPPSLSEYSGYNSTNTTSKLSPRWRSTFVGSGLVDPALGLDTALVADKNVY
ncbi:MAG: hypothetical protein M1821_006418 [Bathelium mastoideum]|nr:MAG: hypothetical protein M1821_006418 [Bathelium mastoideum]KAI9693695.1 MAG: hypothetical protein M1822_002966 [Bathelium mastoideum]